MQIRKEIFYLAYALHWSHEEILDLSIDERHAYVQLLSAQIERENKAMEQASRRRSTPRIR